MAYPPNENVYTQTFTPREFQVELLESARSENTIVCCNTSAAKTFIVVKLVQELSLRWKADGLEPKAVFLFNEANLAVMAIQLQNMTNIACEIVAKNWNPEDITTSLKDRDVILTTAEIFDDIITNLQLDLTHFRLVVIDDCLYGDGQQLLSSNLMRLYNNLVSVRPRILGLVSGLLTADMQPVYLESEMRRLERLLCSRVDTSSELVTLVRHSSRPRESLLECARNNSPLHHDVNERVRTIMLDAKHFLAEHRYDLAAMYGDEFMDELKAVPNPTETPIELIEQFLAVLDDMGLWAADQAALRMLDVLERLKVKVPFERHFILLRMVTTVMVMVRALCDSAFCDMDELDKIIQFSSPKVLKFIEVIKEFRPADCDKPPAVPAAPSDVANDVAIPVAVPTIVNHAGRGGKRNMRAFRRSNLRPQNEDSLCALVFVDDQYTAKVLFSLLSTLSRIDNYYWWIAPQYVLNKVSDPVHDPKEAEQEHLNQEESLRKFRAHECNIMIATSVIEHGCDLPRCNLVVRFNLPTTFHSYVQSKARARAPDAHFIVLADEDQMVTYINQQLAQYLAVESNLLQRCQSLEPSDSEKSIADEFSSRCEPYRTSDAPDTPSVSLSTAIALVNRYCAKLPSDTFTRLTPLWTITATTHGFICVLRLPINSPVKQTVHTPPMANQLLARRVAAFFICQLLHKAGELDDNLLPVGKENFRASEEGSDCQLDSDDEQLVKDNVSEQRPGTTKRRQYYYKCIAEPLADCAPQYRESAVYFYRIVMTLTCPLPEEQNTRGRRIYPPEESPQGFGILTAKKLPIICDFPIFTRSGEVSVRFELCDVLTDLSAEQIVLINNFVKYTFDNVLRLQKYMMDFDPTSAPSAYMIIPTYTNGSDEENQGESYIDWGFMNVIYVSEGRKPNIVPDADRCTFHFDPGQYGDAVVMPWYRNQDQPQYFYVAEICTHLNPTAEFPGFSYATFEEYYLLKYNIQIQNREQYLLDVDHTSARLNFLTPRYVNRKGVALPTSSEETKRAKRENLEQKQILIPELCDIHPFPASLWRKAVCLPCILYRMNALLLADQVRMIVALEMGLGTVELEQGFEWPSLSFGWSLSDVLQRFKAQEHKISAFNSIDPAPTKSPLKSKKQPADNRDSNTNSDSSFEEIKRCNSQDVEWVEIGTWSNEMATTGADAADPTVRYSTPTGWANQGYEYTSGSGEESFTSSDADGDEYDDFDDDDDDYSSDCDSNNGGTIGKKNPTGLHIEFKEGNVAEAVDNRNGEEDGEDHQLQQHYTWEDFQDGGERADPALVQEFQESVKAFSVRIRFETNGSWLLDKDQKYTRTSTAAKLQSMDGCSKSKPQPQLICPALNKKTSACITEKKRDQLLEFPDDDIVKQIKFSFDLQPNLAEHPGPSPSIILQALTMSNANDGINLERLETIGDSFLKYAITDYLYTKYEHVHEGKLSHLRSKQVSNLNLYRLGKRKRLGEKMIATKFDPHDNWLPPCYYVPKAKESVPKVTRIDSDDDDDDDDDDDLPPPTEAERMATRSTLKYLEQLLSKITIDCKSSPMVASVPYNLVTQHSIPDKSIADCVEALIGAYLIECGPRGALLFMAWLGIKVLPPSNGPSKYGDLPLSPSPLLRNIPDPEAELELLLDGYHQFEEAIHYRFNDRSYLLQSLTHASYSPNQLTDCYQRLEFLGDAVLDYLITRHLYEDARMHSPGALTDLRSALVNNTIFASLAVRFGFHKYFKHLSPGLYEVVEKFIRQQEANGHGLMDELYLMAESECKEVEDVEVPKSLGDIFESVAGAIFLDSGRSLDAVWRVYYRMMAKEIEQFSDRVPKSPIRELLELEPETAKFGTPEKLADGRRVRVTVEVFGKGVFKGIGRNYRIAKCTAAKCALKYLRKNSGNTGNTVYQNKRS